MAIYEKLHFKEFYNIIKNLTNHIDTLFSLISISFD